MDEIFGLVSRIQRFSLGDGPGIRTTVFLQGCNLSCSWCHNPETIPQEPTLLFFKDLCSNCGECVKTCPYFAHEIIEGEHRFFRERCMSCGACVESCDRGSLFLSGQKMSVSEVHAIVRHDIDFYNYSGGGLTLSGGEPLLQSGFCAELARMCKDDGISVIIDTAACVDFERFLEVTPFIDEVYFDIKSGPSFASKSDFGLNGIQVFENLKRLVDKGVKVRLRFPIIPNINDNEENIASISALLLDIGVKSIDILPFHRLGSGKYSALGKTYRFMYQDEPGPEKICEITDAFNKHGIIAKTV